ncbi:MAG: SufS family cysteine desulfurase [Mobiluncus porci]|uniref:aminotransferase class V-fold PLP-dependent enzyme n=1 Tax=Mobiluncus TaxID=2050 RepID=UPI0023F54257|nr:MULTISPECIES: SufS family cysteine desulfurase [Mobiluncus]MCI6585274.1 SufS family cysteine desulfurase [Mobiluncus sp.]MDD7541515.1 SufS family cysteine desulfurase [Mobiluncus porci]MDY5748500.1 SufS family cysteine desulfurase [Mobiluncus porci]
MAEIEKALDFTEAELARIRADFPILSVEGRNGQPIAYLDSAATSQKPQVVLDTLDEFYRFHNGAVHRGTHQLGDEATSLFEDARGVVADFLGVKDEEEIVWTQGATAALNMVAYGFFAGSWEHTGGPFDLKSGDEIVFTRAEHHANLVPWQLVARRTGAVTKVIDLLPDGRLDLSHLEEVITERTRVVAFTHLSNVTGAITDIEPIIEAARAVGAVVVLDTCQSGAHLPLDLDSLGVDFACFSGHKMLGPTGVGALWGRRELLEQLPIIQSGGSMIEDVSVESSTFLPVPYRFEAGTQPVAQIVGWAAALRYLQGLGMDRIAVHERALTAYALPRLLEISGVKLLGPTDLENRAGVLSFEMKGIHPHDLGQFLDSLGVAVRVGHHCAIPLHKFFGVTASTRATFSPTTTFAEIDRWLEGLPRAADFFGTQN